LQTVLITGGAGSVGRDLAAMFIANGDRIRLFDLPQMDYTFAAGWANAEIVKGDITDAATVAAAVKGTDAIVHLAALLPPASERSRERTELVNVKGTGTIVEAIRREAPAARLVFSSSVSTYGDTTKSTPPITVSHSQQALDLYAESKIAGEKLMMDAIENYTILRISGISIPAFLEPPSPWPFMREQRMEFINRTDVVKSLFAAASAPGAAHKVLNVAGGSTWRMLGYQYVQRFYEVMDLPVEEATYMDTPGWCDWYETTDSQAILGYQDTTFPAFLDLLAKAVEEALG
jgi:nucleoside-diphosphate-sugar epimerase